MTEYIDRVVRFRLLPETRGRANILAQIAGANRCVWNAALKRNEALRHAREAAMKAAGWDGKPETRADFNKHLDEAALRDAGWDGDKETRKDFYKKITPDKFPKPDYSYNGLTNWFSGLRPEVTNEEGEAWLAALPSHAVRSTLKDLAEAYDKAFDDRRKGIPKNQQRGFPKFKSRHKRGRRADGFWIDDPSLKDGTILIPQAQGKGRVLMKLRRHGKSPYAECRVKRARVVLDGKKWFVFLWYAVPLHGRREDGTLFCEPPVRNREVIGVDRNTINHGIAFSAPITLPDGTLSDKSFLPKRIHILESRRRRYQRAMSRKADAILRREANWDGKSKTRKAAEAALTKKRKAEAQCRLETGKKPSKRAFKFGTGRYSVRYAITAEKAAKTAAEIRGIRENWAHQTARAMARMAEIVGLESLTTKSMTSSAKGDEENPGKNVRQKAGLNRSILGAGWGALEKALEYKYKRGEVVPINPRNTSRRCHQCGEINKAMTLNTRQWRCAACGTKHDRDKNAAMNIAQIACAEAKTSDAILARGHGAAARGGRSPPLKFGRSPPSNRRNSSVKQREVKPSPPFSGGPSGAKREQ